MDLLVIVMRFFHIFSGVFWVGVLFFMISLVQPTMVATGEEGKKFMQHLTLKTCFSNAMLTIALLNVTSGLVMYWRVFEFSLGALSYGYGLVMTIGSLVAFVAFLTGFFMQNRSMVRMKTTSVAIASAGGLPSDADVAELQDLSGRISRGGRITTIFLSLANLGMGVARYIVF
jgi:hypothetical protein